MGSMWVCWKGALIPSLKLKGNALTTLFYVKLSRKRILKGWSYLTIHYGVTLKKIAFSLLVEIVDVAAVNSYSTRLILRQI